MEIAEDVTDAELAVQGSPLHDHFEPVPKGEKAENPKDPSFEPREPETLSEMQDYDQKARREKSDEDRIAFKKLRQK